MHSLALNNCPFCEHANIRVSQRKSAWEKIAVVLMIRPVRCHGCMNRFYRPLFVATPLPLGRILEWEKTVRRINTAASLTYPAKIRNETASPRRYTKHRRAGAQSSISSASCQWMCFSAVFPHILRQWRTICSFLAGNHTDLTLVLHHRYPALCNRLTRSSGVKRANCNPRYADSQEMGDSAAYQASKPGKATDHEAPSSATLPPSNCSATSQQIEDQNDERYDEQQVDKSSAYVQAKAEKPQNS